MKKQLVAVAVVLAFVSAPAFAQFKLPKLPGQDKPAPATQTAPPNGDALVLSFAQSQDLVIAAQNTFGEALGLKDQLAGLQAEHQALSSGPVDVDAIKKRKAWSEATQKLLDEKMAGQPELTTASRAKFTEGLVTYLKAAVGARNLLLAAQSFGGTLTANPMALVGKAQAATYVAKSTPGYVKDVAGTTRTLLAFAQRNNIKAPANATAALEGL